MPPLCLLHPQPLPRHWLLPLYLWRSSSSCCWRENSPGFCSTPIQATSTKWPNGRSPLGSTAVWYRPGYFTYVSCCCPLWPSHCYIEWKLQPLPNLWSQSPSKLFSLPLWIPIPSWLLGYHPGLVFSLPLWQQSLTHPLKPSSISTSSQNTKSHF